MNPLGCPSHARLRVDYVIVQVMVIVVLVPLVVTDQQMDEGLDVLEAALSSVSEKRQPLAAAVTK